MTARRRVVRVLRSIAAGAAFVLFWLVVCYLVLPGQLPGDPRPAQNGPIQAPTVR